MSIVAEYKSTFDLLEDLSAEDFPEPLVPISETFGPNWSQDLSDLEATLVPEKPRSRGRPKSQKPIVGEKRPRGRPRRTSPYLPEKRGRGRPRMTEPFIPFVPEKRRRGRPRSERTLRSLRTYLCSQCGKELKTIKGLQIHVRAQHTGERPYGCDKCGKRFYCESVLSVHRVCHTGAKPFGCDLCDKRFTQRSTLTVHKRYHTGERPYSCQQCGKAYVTKFLLNMHIQKCSKSHFDKDVVDA